MNWRERILFAVTLCLVMPAPSALFFLFSAGAAEQAAQKIPHYGKYSYLAFENGTNRVKGTWSPAASPIIHDFLQD